MLRSGSRVLVMVTTTSKGAMAGAGRMTLRLRMQVSGSACAPVEMTGTFAPGRSSRADPLFVDEDDNGGELCGGGLDGGGEDALDADAVAAHDGCDFFAVSLSSTRAAMDFGVLGTPSLKM